MTAIRELNATELDSVAGGSVWSVIRAAFVGTVCKGAAEAFVGGLATGLETGGVGFVVAAAGGVAGAACVYYSLN